eukprot:jgi/Chrzof1/1723/Cz10g18190.t1
MGLDVELSHTIPLFASMSLRASTRLDRFYNHHQLHGGACCICVRRYMSVNMPHFTHTIRLTSAQRQLSYCLLSQINLHMV